MKKIKCVVIGNEDSGKTCLIKRFLDQDLKEECSHLWLNEKDKYVTLLDENFLLKIFDTPGGKDYERIRNLIYTDVHVFVLCFSIMSIESFDSITNVWIPEIKKFEKSLKDEKKIPYILIGLQNDLRNEGKAVASLGGERPIQNLEGQDLAAHINAYSYFECSSIKNEGIHDVFEGAINAYNNSLYTQKKNEILKKTKKRKSSPKCSLM